MKTKEDAIKDFQHRLTDAGLSKYLFGSIRAALRGKIMSKKEIQSVLIELIKKNEKKVHRNIWEMLSQTDVAWGLFCQSFGKNSKSTFGKPPFQFRFTAAGRGELGGVLLLPCGDDIPISKYGKKLAQGIINMESMIRMWSNTRPEIVGVTYCEVDTTIGENGIIEEDYAPYLAVKVGVEIDLLAVFES